MTFDEAEILYPCVDRSGIGYAGCTCNGTYRPDQQLVTCKAYGSHNYPVNNCINCPFRAQHDAAKRQLNG
jgi:hypothetical protein